MKLRTMLYGLTLMLSCFVLTSCVNDEEEICLPDGKTEVLFSLVLQDNAQTRTGTETWNDYDPKETGVEYDNYIDLNNVQMLLFYADGSENDGKYAGKLGSMIHSKIAENVYQYVGTAPTDLSAGEYKFVVLANCADAGLTVGTSTIADLDTKTFNLFAESGNTEYIPMWGVLKTNLTLVAGNRQEIGRISLLRAISKVTVKLQAPEGATVDPLRGYSLEKVSISNYNKSGYITPTGAATATTTKELNLDASLHAYASAGTDKEFAPASGATELTFYLPEYDNSTTPAQLTVYLTKDVEVEGQDDPTTVEFNAPIQFCDYYTEGDDKGKPDTSKPYNIIRNHWYQFNIYSVSDDGELYVKPTVADWFDGTTMAYPINVSTNMRLFDSWLYRYDTDGSVKPENYGDWATSHIAVAPGLDTTSSPENKPLYSPQIQLVTNIPNDATNGTMELRLDNTNFQFVKVNKTEGNVIDSYQLSNTIAIGKGVDVYTYFYIVPKSDATFTDENSVAKVTLIYIDPNFGELKIPFNYNALPGYSDDSSEIWVHYVTEENYQDGKIGENEFMKMYYQDSNNPLVPVPTNP